MLEFLKRAANHTRTENGAATYATSESDCLDLFATIGALRRQSESEMITRFDRAYAENPDLAMKTLFFARDIRGGLGERRVFRVLLRYIGNTYPQSARKNIAHIASFGRFDDLLCLLDTACGPDALHALRTQFTRDTDALRRGEAVSLLGKWLPSVNASNPETVRTAKRLARAFGLRDREYRQTLSALRAQIAILENNLRQRDYTFDYSKQPSRAMYKYRKAFARNDSARYEAFLSQVAQGEAALHTGTLLPYEIIGPCLQRAISDQERRAMDVTWNALPDFTGGENALAVVDGSGSMYCGVDPQPAAVALSLGMYFAGRNTGAFHNHFITFSHQPRLVEIKGRDVFEKTKYCASFNEVANTDLQRVFSLILDTAVRSRLPQSELPDALYILSDMEFDQCMQNADATNFAHAREAFARHGYRLPRVVFWNVASRSRQQPVTQNQQGAALVSGASPQVFSLLRAGALSPMDLMLSTLQNERYAAVVA